MLKEIYTHQYKFILLLGIIITGCASQDAVDRENTQTTIQVNHGVVENVEEVEIKSKAAQGAVLGGMIGLASTHGSTEDNIAGAATGAVIGGLLTKALEGSNKANAYTIHFNNGSTVKVIIESKTASVGDCVAVETGKTTNLRKVSSALCESSKPHPATENLHVVHQRDAKGCHEAKMQLLDAKTEEDINAIERKIRILCEY